MLTITNRSAFNTTLFLSIAFHIIVLYFIVTSWSILPKTITQPIERTFETVVLQPPPPKLVPPEEAPVEPRFHVREPVRTLATPVDPVPIPPREPTDRPPGQMVDPNPPVIAPTSRVLPTYPAMALDRGIEGRVVLSITIMPDGRVGDVRIVEANPPGVFDRSAVNAVSRWRYPPSNEVRSNVIVFVDYTLSDSRRR